MGDDAQSWLRYAERGFNPRVVALHDKAASRPFVPGQAPLELDLEEMARAEARDVLRAQEP